METTCFIHSLQSTHAHTHTHTHVRIGRDRKREREKRKQRTNLKKSEKENHSLAKHLISDRKKSSRSLGEDTVVNDQAHLFLLADLFPHGKGGGEEGSRLMAAASLLHFGFTSSSSTRTPPQSFGWRKITGLPCAPIFGSFPRQRMFAALHCSIDLAMSGVSRQM